MIVKTDLKNEDMRAVSGVLPKVAGADIAAVFYAGHGLEIGGRNYLIPIDARLEYDTDVKDGSDRPGRRSGQVGACDETEAADPRRVSQQSIRADEEFGLRREIGRGLRPPEQEGSGTLIAFAAAPGATAADGEGDH